jgi:ribonucleoside-diphosphate reductase alpha chain
MFRRVANSVARAEDLYSAGQPEKMAEAFYDAMNAIEFLQNSSTIMNAGRELGQLAACFVLPVEDSLDSIFEAIKETAKIQLYRILSICYYNQIVHSSYSNGHS